MGRIASLGMVFAVLVGCGQDAGSSTASKGMNGKQATLFTLQDSKGKEFSLSGAIGKSPVVLVFYRGDW